MDEKDQKRLEGLETIAEGVSKLRKLHKTVDGEIKKYSKWGRVLDKFTKKGTYQQIQNSSTYVSGILEGLDNKVSELIESYKEE